MSRGRLVSKTEWSSDSDICGRNKKNQKKIIQNDRNGKNGKIPQKTPRDDTVIKRINVAVGVGWSGRAKITVGSAIVRKWGSIAFDGYRFWAKRDDGCAVYDKFNLPIE